MSRKKSRHSLDVIRQQVDVVKSSRRNALRNILLRLVLEVRAILVRRNEPLCCEVQFQMMAIGRQEAESTAMSKIAIMPFARDPILQQKPDHRLKHLRTSRAKCQVAKAGLRAKR